MPLSSMAEESKKFWRVNCIFYVLLFKVLGRNSVDPIQLPLEQKEQKANISVLFCFGKIRLVLLFSLKVPPKHECQIVRA